MDLNKLKYLIIDEVHFINNVGLILKNLIDDIRWGKYDFKIICSGSGSLNVFKGFTDSLVGRYDIIYVFGFDFLEFLEYKGVNINLFKIEEISEFLINQIRDYFFEYLKFGGYPEVVMKKTEEEKKKVMSMIIEDYFYKDVKNLLTKSDFLNFNKVLKILSENVGSVFSVSKFIEEVGINRYLFEKIKFVLENTFLVKFLPSFNGCKDKLELKRSNKVYFFDIGVWRYFLGINDRIGDFKGKAVENFIFSQVISNKKIYEDLYFRQRRNETEIDFLLLDKIDKFIKLIEIKSGKKDNIPKSIKSFLTNYGDFVNKIVITYDGPYKKET